MNSRRVEYLKQLAMEEPDDPFPLYGLAMEYIEDDPEIALGHLNSVYEKFPDYLPLYYQLASVLLEIGHMSEAEKIISEGKTLAGKLGDRKAKDELSALEETYL